MERDRVLVHAGLVPQWTGQQAVALSREVQEMLASSRASEFLGKLYGNEPDQWRDDLDGFDRLRVIVNACTRLRFCRADGSMEFHEKRGAAYAPAGMMPWYEHPHRAWAGTHVVCGHWSTLGLMLSREVSMLDTGCVWGGSLTAMRLFEDADALRIYQVPSRAPVNPATNE